MKQLDPIILRARSLLQPFAKRVNLDVHLAAADPELELSERVAWLHDLILWLRSPFVTNEERSDLSAETQGPLLKAKARRISKRRRLQTVRLRYFMRLIDRNPVWKKNVAAVLRSILWEASAVDLFGSTGLSRESGFFSEASNRLQRKFLPVTIDTKDFADLFVRLFRDESDPAWIRGLPIEMVESLLDLIRFEFAEPDRVFSGLHQAMLDAILMLAPEIASAGLSPELRIRMDDRSISTSPFYTLNESLFALVHVLRGEQPDLLETLLEKIKIDLALCRERHHQVIKHLEERGVSIALVYKLEKITKSLERIEDLMGILIPSPTDNRTEVVRDFTAHLVDQSIEATKLRRLIGSNMDLISRKIVERVGYAGDHYIAATSNMYWHMFRAAGGGGFVTVFTTVVKTFALHAGLPLFFEGILASANYAASFLVIQFAHFALATKQPSMTATTLANRLVSLNRRHQLEEFVNEVSRITRTQFAAALGNVAFVVVGAVAFDLLYRQTLGHSLMDVAYAEKTIKSFNPFTSVTIFAAGITGVILWLSAVIGGWFENWAVFRRIPEAISGNRFLQLLIGANVAEKISSFVIRHISGIVSNVSIGVMLGFTPIVGKFFGLPIDIRHVTLAAGSLTFAISAVGVSTAGAWNVGLAVFGIFTIFLMNFGVAYSLALFVALRARRIKRVWVHHLLKAVGRRFLKHGSEFFFPTGT